MAARIPLLVLALVLWGCQLAAPYTGTREAAVPPDASPSDQPRADRSVLDRGPAEAAPIDRAIPDTSTKPDSASTGWPAMKSCTSTTLLGVAGVSATEVIAVGAMGKVCYYDGNPKGEWKPLNSGTTNTLNAVRPFGTDRVLVVGAKDTMLECGKKLGGCIPSPLNTKGTGLPSINIMAAWCPSSTGCYVAGYSSVLGTALYRVKRPSTWDMACLVMTAGTELHAVYGHSLEQAMGVGTKCIYNHVDDNKCYQGSVISSSSTLHGIWGSGEKNVWAVGTGGLVVRWDGKAWKVFPTGQATTLRAIWGTSASNVYAVGNNGVLLHHDSKGWQRSKIATKTLYGVWAASPQDVFAVGSKGTIVRNH